jgi:hypothetical protein
MTNKTTKKENFMALHAIVENLEIGVDITENKKDNLMEFIEHEIELLKKKNSHKSTKPTKKQEANKSKALEILGSMEPGRYYSAKELGEMNDVSFQKIVALVKNDVSRETYKGRAFYYIGEKPLEYPELEK